MILDDIVKHKKTEVAYMYKSCTIEELACAIKELPPTISFYDAIKSDDNVSLIAEVKKASPSKGIIRQDFAPLDIAKIYTENGAAAISVLTDEKYFQGSPDYLKAIREITKLPLLRKEFIIDQIQIYQARTLGADAVLLIAAILSDEQLISFQETAAQIDLQCLVEVHTEEELHRVLKTGARIIGINNRNLNTFKTDINTTFKLRELISAKDIAIISESGINNRTDVDKLSAHQIDAMLVGEALVREKDIAVKIKELLIKVDD